MSRTKLNQVSRRDFLRLAGCAVGGGGLFLLLRPEPAYAAGIRPPGTISEVSLAERCIHCGRCEAVCEQLAIRLGADGVPAINGLDGWCNFCMCCAEECPTDALVPTEPEGLQIGTAVIDRDRCIAWDHIGCRLCYEFCLELYQAIWIDEDYRPHVDPEKCVGCGACVYVCPQSARLGMNRKYGKAVALI